MQRPTSPGWEAWCAAHHLTVPWWAGSLGAWFSVALFSAVVVPVKYPFEARGTAIDSGSVVALAVPIAVMAVMLDEGPTSTVATAARRLGVQRLATAAGFLASVVGCALTLAWAAGLPRALLQVDALAMAALALVGTALLGTTRSWILPLAWVLVMSAPGLVPWEANVIYHRDVGLPFLVGTVTTSVLGIASYGVRGSVPAWGRDRA